MSDVLRLTKIWIVLFSHKKNFFCLRFRSIFKWGYPACIIHAIDLDQMRGVGSRSHSILLQGFRNEADGLKQKHSLKANKNDFFPENALK